MPGRAIAQTARVFLETTSVRGVGKVVKSQNSFLSRLWALFVLASSTFLFYSVFKITVDYLQYDVNIQTFLDIDDATPFPAVSICNNQPFSKNAYDAWSAGLILSPSAFNRNLRQKAFDLLNDSSLSEAYRLVVEEAGGQDTGASISRLFGVSLKAMINSLVMDNSRMYYQNLKVNESHLLGHTRDDSIVDCIFKYGSNQVQGTRGCKDSMIKVTEFSHPNFFNCMTLEFKPGAWKEIFSLTLIIWLGPEENYDVQYRQGFLFDVFEQAYGLRVSIHEPGTPPRIVEQGMQTEPGKMNEIKYRPVRFVRENTPKNPCIDAKSNNTRKFRDLNHWYSYDIELCLNSKVQEVIMQKCQCMYIELPRVSLPNATYPYCGFMDERISHRSQCLRSIDQRQLRKVFEGSECVPKCSDLSYEKELSMTKWRETQWMLYWIKEVSERWNNHFKNIKERTATPQEFDRDLQRVKDYLKMDNISNYRALGKFSNNAGNFSTNSSFHFDDRYTFLVVKRESNNTLVKMEKIVLTLNALFSRIGGLCSMYMGLTLAFFVECIELLYKLIWSNQAPSDPEVSKVVDANEHLSLMTYVDQDAAQKTPDAGNATVDSEVERQTADANCNRRTDQIWVPQQQQQQQQQQQSASPV